MATDLQARFWLCPGCGRHVPVRLDQCRCGTARPAGNGTAAATGGPVVEARDGPVWYAVGTGKLVVMSVATVGLYQVYWFYRQWRAVRDAGEDVRVLPRSIFGVLFCFPLFRRVVASAQGMAAPAAEPVFLAAVYIALCVCSRLPFPYAMLSVLSVVPLVAIQRVANAVTRRDFPHESPDTRFTGASWAAIGLGCVFFGLLAWVALARAKATSLESLTRVADRLNRAPREASDDGILLDRVVPEEGRLIYRFKVTEEARAAVEQRMPILKPSMTRRVCSDALLKMGVAVRFVYTAPGGDDVAVVDILPRDCS